MQKQFSLKRLTLFLVIGILASAIITGTLTYYFTNQYNKKEYDDLITKNNLSTTPAQTITTTETSTPTPSTTNAAVVTTTDTATPSTTSDWKMYKYDYLDISFSYPSTWTVKEDINNTKGGNYTFDCNSDATFFNTYLKNKTLCADNIIMPRNLVLEGPNKEKITLWNASGLGGCCEDQLTLYRTFQMYNASVSVPTYGRDSQGFDSFIATDIKTGNKSAWKKYMLTVNVEATPNQTTKSKADTVEKILQSFVANS